MGRREGEISAGAYASAFKQYTEKTYFFVIYQLTFKLTSLAVTLFSDKERCLYDHGIKCTLIRNKICLFVRLFRAMSNGLLTLS